MKAVAELEKCEGGAALWALMTHLATNHMRIFPHAMNANMFFPLTNDAGREFAKTFFLSFADTKELQSCSHLCCFSSWSF